MYVFLTLAFHPGPYITFSVYQEPHVPQTACFSTAKICIFSTVQPKIAAYPPWVATALAPTSQERTATDALAHAEMNGRAPQSPPLSPLPVSINRWMWIHHRVTMKIPTSSIIIIIARTGN